MKFIRLGRLLPSLPRLFLRGLLSLYTRIGQHGFVLIWATLTGLVTGLTVVVIRLVAIFFEAGSAELAQWKFWAVLPLPVIGIMLAGWIKRRLEEDSSSRDMTELMTALRTGRPGRLKLSTLSHIAVAPLTVGLGASAGLTTPGVLAGASLGSTIGKVLHVPFSRRVRLMTCGSAAAVSAIFNCPISGVLFAIEALLPRSRPIELVPILFAAAGASVVTQGVFGAEPYFHLPDADWYAGELGAFLLLGLGAALLGVFIVRLNRNWEDKALHSPLRPWQINLIAGLFTALWVGLFPALAGEGGGVIHQLFTGDGEALLRQSPLFKWVFSGTGGVFFFALAVMLLKPLASAATLNGGGAGGHFAPTLFTGAFAGLAFAEAVRLLGWGELPPGDMVAAGMCGVFAAAFRAPLTAIFLVSEMSGTYRLMLPLIVVAAAAFFLAGFLEKDSIYVHADERSEKPEPTAGVKTIRDRIEHRMPLLAGKAPDWAHFLKHNPGDSFAVVDSEKKLLGVIRRSRIENRRQTPPPLLPEELMQSADTPLLASDRPEMALGAFNLFAAEELPVVNHHHLYQGFLTRQDLTAASSPAASPPAAAAAPEASAAPPSK